MGFGFFSPGCEGPPSATMAYTKKQLAEYTREASECFSYNDRSYKGKIASAELIGLMQSMGQ